MPASVLLRVGRLEAQVREHQQGLTTLQTIVDHHDSQIALLEARARIEDMLRDHERCLVTLEHGPRSRGGA